MATIVAQINSNFGNLNQILLQGLKADSADTSDIIACILSLSVFSRLTRRGYLSLMDHVPAALPQPTSYKLKARVITEVFSSSRAVSHFCHFNDSILEAHHSRRKNYAECIECLEKALAMGKSAGSIVEQTRMLHTLAHTKFKIGEYTTAQAVAIETQRLARLSANLYREASAVWVEGLCCYATSNYKHSIFLLQRARDLVGLCGMSGGDLEYRILDSEAEAHPLRSDYGKARQIQTHIFQTISRGHNGMNHATAFLNMAQIDVLIGENEQEVTCNLDHAKGLFSNVDNTTGIAFCEIIMAKLQLREGNTLNAQENFQKYLEGPWMEVGQISSLCLESMAYIACLGEANFYQIFRWAVIYIANATRLKERLSLLKALLSLANVFLANRDQWNAKSLFTVALDGFTSMDVHHSRANCMLHLASLFVVLVFMRYYEFTIFGSIFLNFMHAL
ncbi:hypothetical protein K438DRAFT_1753596 [Mycena galopus ATCC 62051]|nr:hypothetical protein K438DRAFT_1753596 [Mycena galopus ATCC 62051]